MDDQLIINKLETEWDLEKGFLGKLRMGILDVDNFIRLKETLKFIEFKDDVLVNHRVISLLWYIPLFMTWQRERFVDDDERVQFLDRSVNEVVSILEDILGIP